MLVEDSSSDEDGDDDVFKNNDENAVSHNDTFSTGIAGCGRSRSAVNGLDTVVL